MTAGDVTRDFWDTLYRSLPATATSSDPTPNRHLVSEVADLPPGTALDLGCAHGGDALWLAARGWQVSAVDVSQVALELARGHAARAGVSDRISFQRHDLADSFPDGRFDLVSAQFLHSPIGGPAEREQILRRAADAVAPGGHLLITSHQSVPSWHPRMPDGLTEHPLNLAVPTPEETLAALQLTDEEWETIHSETIATPVTSPAGEAGVREDHLLHVARREW